MMTSTNEFAMQKFRKILQMTRTIFYAILYFIIPTSFSPPLWMIHLKANVYGLRSKKCPVDFGYTALRMEKRKR